MAMTRPKKDEGVEREPEARRLRRELFDDEMLDKLMAATDERGLSLTGEGGFLPEMIKAVLERGMQAELTDHLGYDKGDPGGIGSGNSRNGTTPKTVKVVATKENGEKIEFDAPTRIDTPGEADYYRNGGILQFVLRNMMANK